ncbi:MAG: SpoIIE family protein phosphatase [Sulfitobacter sp.]
MSAPAKISTTDAMAIQAKPGAMQLVLLVDDSRLQRKILSSLLKRWGFEVLEAGSGAEALALCRDRLPDLVISDWMMPGMNGLEFCQAFRAESTDHYGYFILLTSKSEKREIARGLDAGADDFLTKPVDGNELRARMRAGERILRMQRQLTEKNRLISETLGELQRVHALIDKDLIEAKNLQQSLLREQFKALDGGDLSLFLRSCGHVGGDLVGFYRAAENHLGLFAIDVSGHGISSALMTARLAGYLSGSVPDQNIALERCKDGTYRSRPPAQAIEQLNNLVLDEMETEHYFTLMLADIDLSSGQVVVGQAGHPHPIVQRLGGEIVQGGPGGFPVGLLPGVTFSQFTVQLNPGDRLFILSDGVTECDNQAGEMLGEHGIENMLNDLKQCRGPALFETLQDRLIRFAGCDELPDDVSGIMFEFSGQD